MAVLEEKDTTLILKGKFKLIEGEAKVFGCPIDNINTEKFIPVYMNGKAEVDGEFIPIKGETIPESWRKAVKVIDSTESKRIFVIGDVDVGKSSFITWLVNNLPNDKCVIDADIGQSDIAHPGAMGVGIVDKTPLLSKVEMIDGFFTGCLSPMGREAKCLRAFSVLCKKVEKIANTTIVDTTGWIRGKKAKEYKAAKIEVFSPDTIVFIGSRDLEVFSDQLLEDNYKVIKIDSFVPKKRNKETRCKLRIKSYEKWFKSSETITIKVKPENAKTTLFKGEPIEGEDLNILSVFGNVIFSEVGYDFLNVCVENMEVSYEAVKTVKKLFNVEDVNIFEPEHLRNLIVGVYSNSRYLCPGLVTDVDFENKLFYISINSKFAKSIDLNSIIVDFGEFKITDEKEIAVKVP